MMLKELKKRMCGLVHFAQSWILTYLRRVRNLLPRDTYSPWKLIPWPREWRWFLKDRRLSSVRYDFPPSMSQFSQCQLMMMKRGLGQLFCFLVHKGVHLNVSFKVGSIFTLLTFKVLLLIVNKSYATIHCIFVMKSLLTIMTISLCIFRSAPGRSHRALCMSRYKFLFCSSSLTWAPQCGQLIFTNSLCWVLMCRLKLAVALVLKAHRWHWARFEEFCFSSLCSDRSCAIPSQNHGFFLKICPITGCNPESLWLILFRHEVWVLRFYYLSHQQ